MAKENIANTSTKNKSNFKGSIRIVSEPSNANIFLNGQETLFRTPITIPDLKPGLNTVEISLPNYLFAKRQINIIPDTTLTISFKLILLSDATPIIGDLRLGILRLPHPPLNTPYIIDNRQIYSQEVTLNYGKHHIIWEGGNRYTSLDTIIEIYPGKLTTFQFEPQRLSGTLTISPLPLDADIYINNRLYSTGELNIRLSTGTFFIQVKRNGCYDREQYVTILPNKNIVLEIDLNQIPDRDNDGFLDTSDLCPDTYGLYNGCPKQKRRQAIRRYREVLKQNLIKQPLIFSVNPIAYLYRKPRNQYFNEFTSLFNDGRHYLNNLSSFIFANTYTISYHGIFLSCELGQSNSPLEFKKTIVDPIIIKTEEEDYCIVYNVDTSSNNLSPIVPVIQIPSTTFSIGINLIVKRFNIAYSIGHQWEDVKIYDLVTVADYEKYKNFGEDIPRTNIIFNNNWWFTKLRCEVDLLKDYKKARPALYATASLSIGKEHLSGWQSYQFGFIYKFFPKKLLQKHKKKKTRRD